QAEDGIRDKLVTGVQTCALPISPGSTLRACSGGPADRRRRATPRASGSPWRNPPPSPDATGRPAPRATRRATRSVLERAALLACRQCGGRPARDLALPVGTETTRRGCRRA